MSDGTRKVTGISEITGMEGDVITMQEIFTFDRAGITPEGKVSGRFRATGHPAEVHREDRVGRHPAAHRHVRTREGGRLRGRYGDTSLATFAGVLGLIVGHLLRVRRRPGSTRPA